MCWPSKPPDINASEHPWPWIRRHVTQDFHPSRNEEMCATQWAIEWGNIPQSQMDKWVDGIPEVVRQIIQFKGDNCFHDG